MRLWLQENAIALAALIISLYTQFVPSWKDRRKLKIESGWMWDTQPGGEPPTKKLFVSATSVNLRPVNLYNMRFEYEVGRDGFSYDVLFAEPKLLDKDGRIDAEARTTYYSTAHNVVAEDSRRKLWEVAAWRIESLRSEELARGDTEPPSLWKRGYFWFRRYRRKRRMKKASQARQRRPL